MASDATSSLDSSSDELYFHLLPPRKYIPNMSSPCLKLETYARMANIKYKPKYSYRNPSTKGKYPWLQHGSKTVEDSMFCVLYLNEAFGVDLDKELTDEQRGVSHAIIKMLEENFYFVLLHYRYVHNNGTWALKDFEGAVSRFGLLNGAVVKVLIRSMKSSLHAQGLGRHDPASIEVIAKRDIKAVSQVLGSKPYMFGDKPSLVDACVFAYMAQILYDSNDTPLLGFIQENCSNIIDLCERVKMDYFPDWDQLETLVAEWNKS